MLTISLCLLVGAAARTWGEVPTGQRAERIEMMDGVELDAIVIEPTTPGPHPIVVLPSAWATSAETFVEPATALAKQGFVVVSYTSRGFFDSGGEIDVAAARTVEDVSEVIDWAIDNTDGDPERIGAMGVSYGAGCSLLASARDARIDAVAALSAWGDLEASVVPNGTVSQAAINLLLETGNDTGNPGPELDEIVAALEAGDFDAIRAFASTRSPSNEVAAINANGTPVYIANAWNDSIFPPSQIIDLFNSLTGPKRILLQPGDHATPEAPAAFGIPTAAFDGAFEWFAAYVRDGGTLDGPQIKLTSNDPDGQAYVGTSFDGLVATKTLYLTAPSAQNGSTGGLGNSASNGWRHPIAGGTDTVADSGPIVLTGFFQQVTRLDPVIALSQVDRDHAAVWESEPLGGGDIVGSPVVTITVDSTVPDTTLIFYLYEKPALAPARLISHKPYTIRQLGPATEETIRVKLEATAWNLEPESRIALVIDTIDDRYLSETPVGSFIGLSSTGSGASLTLPLRTFRLAIAATAGSPGQYDFTWNSQPAKVYELLSSTDFFTVPAGWEVYDPDGADGSDPYTDIPSAGATTMLFGVSAPGSRRFFAVRERDAAPE